MPVVWLCTAPDREAGILGTAVRADVLRAQSRQRDSLNRLAESDFGVARTAERHGFEWADYSAHHIVALAVVVPGFTYDDLALLTSAEQSQRNFYQQLSDSASEEMYFTALLQYRNCPQQFRSLSSL